MSQANPLRTHARVLIASTVGTAVEYYDFFIYATAAALVFGPLFFPAYDPAAQTLLAFVTFGVAFVARPIGAIAFGHFGDRIGRKSTLVASLMLMGASTLGISLLPTYATTGWIAPVLLCLMRFGQGFGLGGEWAGAALLAVENAPRGWVARFGAAPQLGVPLGFAAANGVFLVLGLATAKAEFAAWGWRIPFLLSAVPLAQGAGPLGYPREAFIGVQLVANAFLTLGILVASTHADRTSPGRTLALGSAGTALVGLIFSPGLAAGMGWAGAMLSLALFVMAFTNAPLGSWLSSLFPTRVRYSGVAFAFNFGGVLGGAVTPILAQALSAAHLAGWAGLLIVVSGLVSLVGVLLARPVAPEPAAS